ncbi:hypothetical protein BJX99DRAFT_233772 [Aspergillus californicus]
MPSPAMDLSAFTRPAIMCSCSRCSSTLAVLENEWAKLSNSYSVAGGWLSIELNRVSISSEEKQIPQSSELSLIRGRIIQEIGCKLCQQKLGAVCALDVGSRIFWKLSKVSLREIVSMRTVEPTFKDEEGLLETLLFPKPKEVPGHPGALVPTGVNEIDNYDVSLEHQIQQSLSLDHISTSVSSLHDTMHELKSAFTSMRIELNGGTRCPSETALTNSDFNMIATVLKELNGKADENEKLKLENEALKFRNRYMEEQITRQQTIPHLTVESLPEVGTPGLLEGSRKRSFPFPEHVQGVRENPVADSFEDDDDDEVSIADFSMGETRMPSVKIPLRDRDSEHTAEPAKDPTAPSRSPRLQIEISQHSIHHTPPSISHAEPTAKRPRLSSTTNTSANRRRGRPPGRKSISQTNQPYIPQPAKTSPSHQQNGTTTTNEPSSTSNESHPQQQQHRNSIETHPHTRSLRSRSRPPSPNSRIKMSTENHNQEPGHEENEQQNGPVPSSEPTSQLVVDLAKENPSKGDRNIKTDMSGEKRKAQTAQRDNLAKLAMQREEDMDTGYYGR